MIDIFLNMDVTGTWIYKEDFEGGSDMGSAYLMQDGTKITGKIEYTELIDDEVPFHIQQSIEGLILNNKVVFKGTSYKVLNGEEGLEYSLDSWEGQLNSEGRIIGYSIDQSGICGIFTLDRK